MQLDIPCLVVTLRSLAFSERKRRRIGSQGERRSGVLGGVDLRREEVGVGGSGRSEGMGNCSWDALYERRMKIKIKKITLAATVRAATAGQSGCHNSEHGKAARPPSRPGCLRCRDVWQGGDHV